MTRKPATARVKPPAGPPVELGDSGNAVASAMVPPAQPVDAAATASTLPEPMVAAAQAPEPTLGDLLRASAPPVQPVLVPAARFAMGDDPNVMPPIVQQQRGADFTVPVPSAGPGAEDFAFTDDDLREMAKASAHPLPIQSPAVPGNASSGPDVTSDTPAFSGPSVPGRASGAAGGTPEPEFTSPGGSVRWVSRIRVMEAYRFDGRVAQAPPWVDRNWVGYADEDYNRGIPAGPCLRVPLPNSGQPHSEDAWHAICRVGDYITLQQYLSPGRAPVVQQEVWAKEQFERVFMAELTASSPRKTLENAA